MYLWFYTLLPFAPIVPSTISFHLGTPIAPDELFVSGDDDLDRAYEIVVGRVQDLVLGQGS